MKVIYIKLFGKKEGKKLIEKAEKQMILIEKGKCRNGYELNAYYKKWGDYELH